jgi:hypothetical protein
MNTSPFQYGDLEDPVSNDDGEEEGQSSIDQPAEIELVESSKIPWLQEVFLTATKILVLVVAVAVIAFSIVAKVAWWVIILRAGVSILVLGFLGYLFNWFLGKFLVDAKLAELREKNAAEEAAEMERLAREQAEMDALAMLQEQENESAHFEIET